MAGIFPGFFWVEFSAGEWVYAEIRRGVEIAEGFVRVGIPGFFWVVLSAGEWVYAEIRRGVEIAEGFVRVGIPGFFLGGASC